MVKSRLNVGSFLMGLLLGISVMLLVGAVTYQAGHYQIEAGMSASGDAWAIDTYNGRIWRYADGKWQAEVKLPDLAAKVSTTTTPGAR